MIRVIFRDSQNKQNRINRLAELLLSKSNAIPLSKDNLDVSKKDAPGEKLQNK